MLLGAIVGETLPKLLKTFSLFCIDVAKEMKFIK